MFEALGFVVGDQAVDERGEFAVHHVGELMEREADAVIGHAVLGEVVGADFLGAVAGFDLAAALDGEGGFAPVLFLLVEARAEDAHGFGAVFDLRFFVLLGNHQAAGNVRDAHCGIRRVDGLAAGAGRAESIYAQILGFDLNVDIVGFGQHGNRGRGGVNASLGFRGGNALGAVHAAFVFELGINFVAVYGGYDFFHSAERRRGAFEHFHFPSLRFGVARIHAEKLAGEEGGFIAARAGTDFNDDALFVVGIFREQEQLEFALDNFLARGELFFFLVRHLFYFGVVGFGDHLARAGEIFFDLLELAMLFDDLFEFGVLLGDFLEARGVRDDFRGRKLLRQFVVARSELV